MKKRAQITLNSAPQLVLLIAFTVLILAAGAIALNAIKTGTSTTGSASNADSNTFTAINQTAVFFGDYDQKGNAPVSCTNVNLYNASFVNVTGDFVVSTTACTATLQSDLTQNNTLHQANYTLTLTTYSDTYNISETGQLSLNNLSDQLPTVGTVIGVALIVVVVIGAFAMFVMRGGAL